MGSGFPPPSSLVVRRRPFLTAMLRYLNIFFSFPLTIINFTSNINKLLPPPLLPPSAQPPPRRVRRRDCHRTPHSRAARGLRHLTPRISQHLNSGRRPAGISCVQVRFQL